MGESDDCQLFSRLRNRVSSVLIPSSSAKPKMRTQPSEKRIVGFAFCLVCLSISVSPISGTVTVISEFSNESIVVFQDQPARFVPERVSAYGIQGYVAYANPPNACGPVDPPTEDYITLNVNWILVARRFDCDFQTKILNAQNAGYAAIIIHNVGSNATEAMGADDPSKLVIYACFVGEYAGRRLRDFYSFPKHKNYFVKIQDDFSMNAYLLPFAIVVAVCFVVMLIFMVRLLWQQVVRWIRERRRSRRRKLPSSALKKLPITKWTKGDPYETCAICLDDFVEHDKVRVLPCSHGYHSVCIDPWLTKGRRVCPICKRKVILADERFPPDSDTDDETAPLLGAASTSSAPPNPASSSSTFVQQEQQQRVHPFRCGIKRPARLSTSPHDTDASSTTESEHSSRSGSGDGCRITPNHQSLPVMAEVHRVEGSSGQFGRRELFPSRSTTAIPDYNQDSNSMSCSLFYVSCQEDPEEDEEMLDLSVETHSTIPSAPPMEIATAIENPTVLILGIDSASELSPLFNRDSEKNARIV